MTLPVLRDIAIVILAFEAFIIGLIPLVVLYFLLRAWWAAGRMMAPWLAKAKSAFEGGTSIVEQINRAITEPIFRIEAKWAWLQTFCRQLLRPR